MIYAGQNYFSFWENKRLGHGQSIIRIFQMIVKILIPNKYFLLTVLFLSNS